MEDMTLPDMVKIAAIAVAMLGTIMWTASLGISKVVALNERPERRAYLTALVAYLLITLPATLYMLLFTWFSILVPIAAMPGGYIIHRFWLNDFKTRWFESHAEIPDGIAAENDNWRVGLYGIGIFLLAALGRAIALKMGGITH